MDATARLTQREELVAKARELHPLLAANADTAERDRSLPDENFKALIEAGTLRVLVPARAGGYEAGHRTYLDVVAELARSGCGSSAWYGFILNMNDWIAGMLPTEVQEAVWADGPDSEICATLTPGPGCRSEKVSGGIRLSGQWGYASASKHANWAMIGYPVLDEAGAPVDMGIAVLRMSQVSVEDTWYVTGMAGTGSNTLVLDDVFVPDTFTQALGPLLRGEFPYSPPGGNMYRADVAAVFWTSVAVPVYGLAQAALEATITRMTARPKPVTYTFYTDATKAPSVQAAIAQAAAMIDGALCQARAAADAIDAQSLTGRAFASLAGRHLNSMRAAHAVRQCIGAVELLLDAQGASAFALTNPVQRIWRDMSAAARHGLNLPGLKQEIYGRSLLGADEQQMSALI
jgi:alkylation response protein AidB-like acyl-CoA dehydrogenase